MYDFSTLEPQQPTEGFLPSVAMNFNGVFLENEIEGYRTLNVSGREMLGVELITTQRPLGVITTSKQLPGRTLGVQFKLEAPNNLEFQERFKKLMRLLHTKEQVEIYYNDDPHTYYYGQLSEVGEVPPDRNIVITTFTLHCDSPYKFGEVQETTGAVSINTHIETPPELIRVTISDPTQVVEVTNGPQTIRLDGNFSTSDVVELDVLEGTVTVNGVDQTYTLALDSDFENFTLEEGQTLTTTQGPLQVWMRERWT